MSQDIPLFTEAALAVLDRQPFDSQSKAGYEIMSGGLVWPDEFPAFASSDWRVVAGGLVHRYLIAYRASLTLGLERAAYRPIWEQAIRQAPRWPGLRDERRGERARRRLRAAKRRESRCFEDFERKSW